MKKLIKKTVGYCLIGIGAVSFGVGYAFMFIASVSTEKGCECMEEE